MKSGWLLAFPRRFERPTYRLGGGCSILLSYGNRTAFIVSQLGVKNNPFSRKKAVPEEKNRNRIFLTYLLYKSVFLISAPVNLADFCNGYKGDRIDFADQFVGFVEFARREDT